MKQLLNSAKNVAILPHGNDVAASEVVEVSLLLSRRQIVELANHAQRRGMTSAQFLRQCISNMCQGNPEAA